MKYTKGEWEQTGSTIVKFGKGGAVICQMAEPHKTGDTRFFPLEIGSPDWEMQMANARLITVSPEMCDVLRDILAQSVVGREHFTDVQQAKRLHIPVDTLVRAKHILAKAEGN